MKNKKVSTVKSKTKPARTKKPLFKREKSESIKKKDTWPNVP